jgi:hypothetical protein
MTTTQLDPNAVMFFDLLETADENDTNTLQDEAAALVADAHSADPATLLDVLNVAPQLLERLPEEYRREATAAITLAQAIYDVFQQRVQLVAGLVQAAVADSQQ